MNSTAFLVVFKCSLKPLLPEISPSGICRSFFRHLNMQEERENSAIMRFLTGFYPWHDLCILQTIEIVTNNHKSIQGAEK